MTSCKRFEEEGILLLEQGIALDEHFQHCDDCLVAMAKYEKLQLAIAALDDSAKPGAGWQEAVIQATHKLPPTIPIWKRPSVLSGLAASVAVAFGIVLLTRDDAIPLSLNLEIDGGTIVYRGDSAKPGDQMIITAAGVAGDHAEVRVYKDGNRLVMACSDEPPCEQEKDTLRATYTPTAIGSYRAVVISGEAPPHDMVGTLDADILAVRDQGATALVSDPVKVR